MLWTFCARPGLRGPLISWAGESNVAPAALAVPSTGRPSSSPGLRVEQPRRMLCHPTFIEAGDFF